MRRAEDTAIIIQARMGSTRLPGKVLMPLADVPVLSHVVSRCKAVDPAVRVVVATSQLPGDDAIAEWCQGEETQCLRGDEADVLSRYVAAVQQFDLSHAVRVTADCPLLDPSLLRDGLARYLTGTCDYFSNTLTRSYPRGYDFEIFNARSLVDAAANSRTELEREHVTPLFYQDPNRYRCEGMVHDKDLSFARLTLDTPEDRHVLTELFDVLYPSDPLFGLDEVEELISQRPEILAANAHVEQKSH